MHNGTLGTPWQRFARRVTGIWRDPVESDFAMMVAASLQHEKEGLAALNRAEALAPREDEDGMTAGAIPSPRRSSAGRRRPTYSP